jgi:exonuclease VII large subunit
MTDSIPIGTQMTTFDVISFIASIASLILAIGAIWLSVVFYKMSMAASSATTEAAKGIASSVERLEKLFDKLYSDTFSMMRDTVSDMRKHIWPAEDTEPDKTIEEAEKKADDKIAELRKTFDQQLSEMLMRQKIADDKVSAVRSEMRHLLDRAMISSRQAESEAREETVREYILRELRVLRRTQPVTKVGELARRLRERFPVRRIVLELERMRSEGVLNISSEDIGPETEIRLSMGSESHREAG